MCVYMYQFNQSYKHLPCFHSSKKHERKTGESFTNMVMGIDQV